MKSKILAYCRLMRIDKPIGTLLLLWPTLWAIWLTGKPSLSIVVVFVLGVILMRAAGCVINDYADRNFDGHVARTQHRPLASGQLTEKNALVTFWVLILLSVLLLLTLNYLSWLVAFLAFLTACIYPFMKRYTHLPQVVLGVAFSFGIPMAYAAILEAFPVSCWLLFIANICWTVAYDTQYAMVDRNDDVKIGVKSTAILFGQYDKLMIGLLDVITLLLLIAVGMLNHLSIMYYLSLFITAGLFVYQQILIKDRERESCFTAFLNNNYVGGVIFIGVLFTTTL